MEFQESKKLLRVPSFAKRKMVATKIRVQEMRRNLTEAQAGLNINDYGTTISGGKHITREERFAKLVDMQDRYEDECAKLEEGTKRLAEMISKIYLNNDAKTTMSANEEIKRQRAELIIQQFYVNGMPKWEIITEYNISERTFKYALYDGQHYFFDLVKDRNYEDVFNDLYGDEDN